MVEKKCQSNAKTSLCLLQRPLGHLRLLQNRDAPKNSNKNLTLLKDLHKYQYFLKKFLACNQISSTGFCWGALGANKIQLIDQLSVFLSPFI